MRHLKTYESLSKNELKGIAEGILAIMEEIGEGMSEDFKILTRSNNNLGTFYMIDYVSQGQTFMGSLFITISQVNENVLIHVEFPMPDASAENDFLNTEVVTPLKNYFEETCKRVNQINYIYNEKDVKKYFNASAYAKYRATSKFDL